MFSESISARQASSIESGRVPSAKEFSDNDKVVCRTNRAPDTTAFQCTVNHSAERKDAMKTLLSLIAAALFVAPAFANQELAQKKNCLGCHAVDKKVVGPAYQDVAAKYAGQKDAVDKLTQKVIKGGSGVWGQVPMPPNAVTEAEAKQLVTWVLSLKKK